MNSKLKTIILVSGCCLLCAVLGCQKEHKNDGYAIEKPFPETMVGVWAAPDAMDNILDWHIKFEEDGTISKIHHRVFGQMVVKDGGIYREGQDEGTYMVATLGQVETKYSPHTKIIEVKIVIDDYEMKFLSGTLRGHMYDTFIGRASLDGKTWEVENRNYGWLEGADDPDMEIIDKYPEIIVFTKKGTNDLIPQAASEESLLNDVHKHSSQDQ